ncbi:MAG: hypothetical protein HQK96_10480 [Nitrospirae bacterium]|nr:hypothetical protein [Nitrospirota bacterium]
MSKSERNIPQTPEKQGTKKEKNSQDREMWSKWVKEHPQQAAEMIKDWIGTVDGG